MGEQYIGGAPPPNFMEGINSLPDQIIQIIIMIFIQGKFFALFSILFGLSFAIQMESAERKGQNFAGRFLWRGILLFIIGFVHQLFYRGDILTIYAMLVPFIIPFYKVKKKWILLIAGIFFLSLPRLIFFAVNGSTPLFGLESGFNSAADAAYFEAIQSGTLTEVFSQNAVFGMKTKMNWQLAIFGRFYYTFGYFLLGLWIGKMNIFRELEKYHKFIRKVLIRLSLGLGLPFGLMALTFGTAPQPMDFTHWQHILSINFKDWLDLFMALIILCGFTLLYNKKQWWKKRLSFFAPYGRMALTNYILQTLIGTFLMFGWGLGWIGTIRTLYLFFMALALIGLQTYFSKWWLSKFKYGPLEWLWRSATYLKWQPFRK